jgi:uncharacterized membrane protein (UPF0127 family)
MTGRWRNPKAAAILYAIAVGLGLFGGPTSAQNICDPGTIWLRTPNGQINRITVDLADDPAERAQGLMGVKAMPTSAGMLFAYDAPGHPVFWMKGTLIPLDMLFFDADGRLVKLHSNASPMDETHIDGGPGIRFVLEINGGLASALGLAPGAEMRHPAVSSKNAAWPCE